MEHVPGTIVVALGGNALVPPEERRATVEVQFQHTRESLGVVVDLARAGWRIAVVHGNGPQVGAALARNELAMDLVEPLPLGVLVAGTAGWIGYMIQQSLQNALERSGVQREVVTIISQTVVDPADPSLADPSKPIGNPLDAERADRLRRRGATVGTDAGGRLRRLAPSPLPHAIVEVDVIRRLVHTGTIVIAAGGGGTPVYRADDAWEGLDAVVDKDRTAAIVGRDVGADTLLILTNVAAVFRDWGTERATPIREMTAHDALTMLEAGQFGRGSMAPKIEAATTFIRAGGRRAVIATLAEGSDALRGDAGTTIKGEHE